MPPPMTFETTMAAASIGPSRRSRLTGKGTERRDVSGAHLRMLARVRPSARFRSPTARPVGPARPARAPENAVRRRAAGLPGRQIRRCRPRVRPDTTHRARTGGFDDLFRREHAGSAVEAGSRMRAGAAEEEVANRRRIARPAEQRAAGQELIERDLAVKYLSTRQPVGRLQIHRGDHLPRHHRLLEAGRVPRDRGGGDIAEMLAFAIPGACRAGCRAQTARTRRRRADRRGRDPDRESTGSPARSRDPRSSRRTWRHRTRARARPMPGHNRTQPESAASRSWRSEPLAPVNRGSEDTAKLIFASEPRIRMCRTRLEELGWKVHRIDEIEQRASGIGVRDDQTGAARSRPCRAPPPSRPVLRRRSAGPPRQAGSRRRPAGPPRRVRR